MYIARGLLVMCNEHVVYHTVDSSSRGFLCSSPIDGGVGLIILLHCSHHLFELVVAQTVSGPEITGQIDSSLRNAEQKRFY